MSGEDMVYQELGCLFGIDMLRNWDKEGVATESAHEYQDHVWLAAFSRLCRCGQRSNIVQGCRFEGCLRNWQGFGFTFWELCGDLVDLTEVALFAEIDKVFAHRLPIEVAAGILVAFVGAKVGKVVVCEAHNFFPNVPAIMVSKGRDIHHFHMA
jgi:hypothetical protein